MSKVKTTTKKSKIFFISVIMLFVVYFLINNVSSSVFLKVKDRINVVFYSQNTKFFSLSKNEVNYLIKFPAEVEILVPGGYGYYRSGALAKLVSLEKKPDLFKKAFSATTSTLVDLYFFPAETEIYYEASTNRNFPSAQDIFLGKSNANLFDRFFLFSKFFDRNYSDYKIISFDKNIYNREKFNKDFQGNFYKKVYRAIGENVQIIYEKSYSTAFLISSLIEGEGVRVVDLTQEKNTDKRCRVITKKISLISQEISRFFDCETKIGETTVSDIILELGNLENEWAVK